MPLPDPDETLPPSGAADTIPAPASADTTDVGVFIGYQPLRWASLEELGAEELDE